jgi:hypothetical protein
VLGKINRVHKRAARRREKLPSEFIETEYAKEGADSESVVEDGRVLAGSVFGGRRRLFLAEWQGCVLVGATTLYSIPYAGHDAGLRTLQASMLSLMSEVEGLHKLAQQPASSRMLSQAIDRAIIWVIGRTCCTRSTRGVSNVYNVFRH